MKKFTQKSLRNYFLPCRVHVDHAKTEQKNTLDSNGNKLGREETIGERGPAHAHTRAREEKCGCSCSRRRAREARMSSATSTYAESVASCLPRTPLLRSPPLAAAAAPPRLPVRRRVDFTGDGGLGDDDHEAKRRATQGPAPPPAFREKPCICGRGPCDVVWKERGGWAYVCSSPPKCVHCAWCEESDLNINSQPAYRHHPEPSNPRAFNTPSNRRPGATTPVNVSPQGAGTTPPVNVSPQGAGATTPVNVSPQGARSNGKWLICKCAAGKCRKLTVEGVDYYICPIRKGQGACPYRVLVNAAAEKPQQNGDKNPREDKHLEYNPVKKEANGHNLVNMGANNENGPVNPDQPEDDEWLFDIVDDDIVPSGRMAPAHPTPLAVAACETPSMLHKPIAMAELETQTKSPMPPNGSASPITPRSNCCFRCGEGGHWYKNCPKPPQPCYRCGEVGHRSTDCPKLWARLPVRRGLDFPAASGGLDDHEDFLCRAAEEMERSLHEAKCRASPIAMVVLETRTKSPMPPNGSASPITPRSNCCFRCGEEGHWSKNCPKPPPPGSRCFRCGEEGHWCKNCPEPPPPCSRCSDVGHRSRD